MCADDLLSLVRACLCRRFYSNKNASRVKLESISCQFLHIFFVKIVHQMIQDFEKGQSCWVNFKIEVYSVIKMTPYI